jgi:hemoglobin-like flavoprotein
MDMSGNLTMAGNVTAFSDVRLKGEIETVTEALDKITQLRGVTYIRTDKDAPEGRQMGVISQEIMEVIPEVVTKDSSGMYNVAYGNLAGLFIESIKELKSQLDEARNEIKELRQELLKK